VALRDDPRLRALAVGLRRDRAARRPGARRRRVIEIGVDEGASAVVLCAALDRGAELHLIDPFVRHGNARRAGAWATRRVVDRAARQTSGPRVHWHVDFSANVAARWTLPIDLVAMDGDDSEIRVTKDWDLWHPFVVEGGAVLLHAPAAVVDRLFRGRRALPDWEVAEEVDRAVAVRYAPRAA
jgi:hypothetical protein